MLNPQQNALMQFVDEFAPQLPVQRRIKVYRGMADFLRHPAERAVFQERAMILEEAENRCQHLKLRFNHDGDGKDGQS